MKKSRVLFIAAVLVFSGVLTASAQARFGAGGWKGLNLTDDQKTAIKAIRQNTRQAVAEANSPADKQALVKASREQIKAVLTPEQLAKLKEIRRQRIKAGPRDGLVEAAGRAADLNLTDAQKTQIKAIRDDTRKAVADANSPADRQAIVQAAQEQVKALLTTEQLAVLAAPHQGPARGRPAAGALARLDLTTEQKTAIKAIRASTREALKTAATPAEKRALMQSARQQIKALLTPEQLAKLARMHRRS